MHDFYYTFRYFVSCMRVSPIRMSFNPPTVLDHAAADLYANERQKLSVFNFYLKHVRNVFSHANVQIMFNSDGGLKFSTLDPLRYIYVNLLSSKEFCSQIHCQFSYPRGKNCAPDQKPMVFKSGNSDISACHSGCYNLYDGSMAVGKFKSADPYHGPFTIWSNRMQCCQMHTNSAFAMGFDDFVRSDTHPCPRVDTIGTGFDLDSELHIDGERNESFKFMMNKYYCDDFKLQFDSDHKRCKPSLGQTIFGLLVSETLYKACQYGVRYAASGISATDVNKPELPEVEQSPSLEYDAWSQNINRDAIFFDPNLSLADLGISRDNLHLIFTTEYGWPGRLVEPLILTRAPSSPLIKRVDYSKLNLHRPLHLQVDPATGRRLNDAYDLLGIYKYINEDALLRAAASTDTKQEEIGNNVLLFVYQTVKGLFSPDTAASIGVGVALEYVKKAGVGMRTLADTIESPYITETMVNLAKRALVHDIAPSFARGTANLLASSLRIMSTTLKFGSVALDIIGFLDFFVQFADFFNQRKLQDQGYVDAYSHVDTETNLQSFGYRTVEMSPIHVIAVMENLNMPVLFQARVAKNFQRTREKLAFELDYDKVVDRTEYAQTVVWSSEYMFSLTHNSNGLKIDWSKDSELISSDTDLLDTIDTLKIQSFAQYQNFSENFVYKYKYLKIVLPCTILIVVFYIAGFFWLSCLVLVIVSVLVSFLTFR